MVPKRELLLCSALVAAVSVGTDFAVAENSAASRGFSPNDGSVPGHGVPQHDPPFPIDSPLPDTAPLASTSGGTIFPQTSDGLVGSPNYPPTANADVVGMWTGLEDWPVVAIHANLLPNGHVLTYGTPTNSNLQEAQDFDDWDPLAGLGSGSHTATTNTTGVPNQAGTSPYVNSFCSASKLMPNAQLLVTGGNSERSTAIWNEAARQFTPSMQLQYPRWYASIVRLADNRVLAVGGSTQYQGLAYTAPTDAGVQAAMSIVPEILTPGAGWSILPGAQSQDAFGATDNKYWYPRAYVAPNKSVFGISHRYMWSLDPSGMGSITPVGAPLSTGGGGVAATSVMYDVGKILLAGGGQRSNEEVVPASNQATVIDINSTGSGGVVAPKVTGVGNMTYSRNWGTAVVLPTGKVLVLGGTAYANSGGNAVLPGEIWDPATGNWSATAPAAKPRMYHSTAALLLNGAVLNAGGGLGDGDSNSFFNAQVYFPPYLFTRTNGRVAWANRPTVTAVSAVPAYGASVDWTMADNTRISSISLISLAAVTHSQSTDQRRIPLSFKQTKKTIRVTFPTNTGVLPPGYYQLHIVDSNGVPSIGTVVEFKI